MQLSNLNISPTIKRRRSIIDVKEVIINFIVPIVFLGVSAAAIFLYIVPTSKNIPVLKNELTQKTNEAVVLEAKVAQLTELQSNKELLMGDLLKLSWALEERDKVPELSQQTMQMSKDSGVNFMSLDYTNTNKNAAPVIAAAQPSGSGSLMADPNLYREEKVNVTVTSADFPSIVKFLKTTETSIRLFKVETFRLSGQVSAITGASATKNISLVMASPYLNPAFSTYSETAAPINLKDTAYREFMQKLDTFTNYAQAIDATLPKI